MCCILLLGLIGKVSPDRMLALLTFQSLSAVDGTEARVHLSGSLLAMVNCRRRSILFILSEPKRSRTKTKKKNNRGPFRVKSSQGKQSRSKCPPGGGGGDLPRSAADPPRMCCPRKGHAISAPGMASPRFGLVILANTNTNVVRSGVEE